MYVDCIKKNKDDIHISDAHQIRIITNNSILCVYWYMEFNFKIKK